VKIVRINHKYKEYLKEQNHHFQSEGIGILINKSGNYYYLPITNKIKENLPNHYGNCKFELIVDKKLKPIATIKISDYYLVDQGLISANIEISELEIQEQIYIRKNKKKIDSKFARVLNNSKRRNKKISQYYHDFYKLNTELIGKNRAFGMRYFKDAIKSMSIVEGVNITDENIEKIVSYHNIKVEIPEILDTFAVKTIINLKYAWDEVMTNLDQSISLEYIIKINSIIARDEALEIGKLRENMTTVGGKHIIEPPDEKKFKIEIQKLLQLKHIHHYERDILNLYIYLIISQPFYDGNKRTAFLIANQLFISMGIGILIIQDIHLEEFNYLLDCIYYCKNIGQKDLFIKFLQENCVIRIK